MSEKKPRPVVGSLLAILFLAFSVFEISEIVAGYQTGLIHSSARWHHEKIISKAADPAQFDLDLGGHYLIAVAFLVGAIYKIAELLRIFSSKKEPNQSPEPTAMLVTPRACARVAPSTTVAHL